MIFRGTYHWQYSWSYTWCCLCLFLCHPLVGWPAFGRSWQHWFWHEHTGLWAESSNRQINTTIIIIKNKIQTTPQANTTLTVDELTGWVRLMLFFRFAPKKSCLKKKKKNVCKSFNELNTVLWCKQIQTCSKQSLSDKNTVNALKLKSRPNYSLTAIYLLFTLVCILT